jgi:hypothetical protein
MLPAASSQTLQRAVRLGRLEGDQLVGTEESASENEDESVKELIDLLKSNRIQNIGPDSDIRSLRQSSSLDPAGSSSATVEPQTRQRLAAKTEPKPSASSTGTSTPISDVRRSSPKIAGGSPTFAERQLLAQLEHTSMPSVPNSRPIPPMDDDIPFLWRVEREQTVATSHFLLQDSDTGGTRRLDRPPVVMASAVRESSGGTNKNVSQSPNAGMPRRVSRFKAERS